MSSEAPFARTASLHPARAIRHVVEPLRRSRQNNPNGNSKFLAEDGWAFPFVSDAERLVSNSCNKCAALGCPVIEELPLQTTNCDQEMVEDLPPDPTLLGQTKAQHEKPGPPATTPHVLILLPMAAVATAVAVAMAAVSARDRGGTMIDRALLLALAKTVCACVHLLPALSRRRVMWLSWAACLFGALYGHVTFFTHAGLRAAQVRAQQSESIADVAK